jgi:hypothetical protein
MQERNVPISRPIISRNALVSCISRASSAESSEIIQQFAGARIDVSRFAIDDGFCWLGRMATTHLGIECFEMSQFPQEFFSALWTGEEIRNSFLASWINKLDYALFIVHQGEW